MARKSPNTPQYLLSYKKPRYAGRLKVKFQISHDSDGYKTCDIKSPTLADIEKLVRPDSAAGDCIAHPVIINFDQLPADLVALLKAGDQYDFVKQHVEKIVFCHAITINYTTPLQRKTSFSAGGFVLFPSVAPTPPPALGTEKAMFIYTPQTLGISADSFSLLSLIRLAHYIVHEAEHAAQMDANRGFLEGKNGLDAWGARHLRKKTQHRRLVSREEDLAYGHMIDFSHTLFKNGIPPLAETTVTRYGLERARAAIEQSCHFWQYTADWYRATNNPAQGVLFKGQFAVRRFAESMRARYEAEEHPKRPLQKVHHGNKMSRITLSVAAKNPRAEFELWRDGVIPEDLLTKRQVHRMEQQTQHLQKLARTR